MKQEIMEFYEALGELMDQAKELKKLKKQMMEHTGQMAQRRRRRPNGQFRNMGGGAYTSAGSMNQRREMDDWDDDGFWDDDDQ